MLHLVLMHLYLASDTCSKGILGNGTPGLYDHLCSGTDVSIGALNDSLVLIANVIRIILWFAGALSIIFIIVGGIFYVISAGDPGRLKRARDILTNVITGLVVILLGYAIVTFIANGIS